MYLKFFPVFVVVAFFIGLYFILDFQPERKVYYATVVYQNGDTSNVVIYGNEPPHVDSRGMLYTGDSLHNWIGGVRCLVEITCTVHYENGK